MSGSREPEVVLARQGLAHVAVAGGVVDRRDAQVLVVLVVEDREQAQVADDLGRQVLADEALVLEVAHRVVQRRQPGRAGDLREPLAVLVGRVLADPAQVGVHREAERIRIEAAVGRVADRRLEDHVGVRLQPLDHHAVGEVALVVQGVEQRVMPERRPALVHHLRLPLRIEVLGDLAHDPHDLALPGLEQRRVLLDEVEDVLLRLGREALHLGAVLGSVGPARQRAPDVVDLGLGVGQAVVAPRQLLGERELARPVVAVDAVVLQRMAAVERVLDLLHAVLLLALGDVVPGVDQVVDDRRRVGPEAEQVVALEEAVVAVGRVGDHQRLHRGRVLLHQVADAGVGIDDDLVGQAHLAAAVAALVGDELLAVAPVPVVHRHADRGVGVHHLLGGDDLELVRIGVEREALRDGADLLVVLLDQLEGPVARVGQRRLRPRPGRQRRERDRPLRAEPAGAGQDPRVERRRRVMVLHAAASSRLKRSRNTG